MSLYQCASPKGLVDESVSRSEMLTETALSVSVMPDPDAGHPSVSSE
jgi:hypothetical protein